MQPQRRVLAGPHRAGDEAAGHTEVRQQRGGCIVTGEANQQIFAASLHVQCGGRAVRSAKVRCDWPAQPCLADRDVVDTGASERRRRAAADSFYFGKFRHSVSVEAASSQACGCMLSAMKHRYLALAVALATASAVTFIAPLARAQMPRPMSSQAVNDRAVVMGIPRSRVFVAGRCHERCRDVFTKSPNPRQDAKVAERAVDLLVRTRRVDDAKEIASPLAGG